MLKDDIRAALARNDREHARKLFMALRDFLSMHPEGHPSLSGIMMCAAREPLRSLRPMWHKAPSVCALPRCRRLA